MQSNYTGYNYNGSHGFASQEQGIWRGENAQDIGWVPEQPAGQYDTRYFHAPPSSGMNSPSLTQVPSYPGSFGQSIGPQQSAMNSRAHNQRVNHFQTQFPRIYNGVNIQQPAVPSHVQVQRMNQAPDQFPRVFNGTTFSPQSGMDSNAHGQRIDHVQAPQIARAPQLWRPGQEPLDRPGSRETSAGRTNYTAYSGAMPNAHQSGLSSASTTAGASFATQLGKPVSQYHRAHSQHSSYAPVISSKLADAPADPRDRIPRSTFDTKGVDEEVSISDYHGSGELGSGAGERRVPGIEHYALVPISTHGSSSASSTCQVSRVDTPVNQAPGPSGYQSPWALSQIIKNGGTEDPSDAVKLNRKYTTPFKLPVPAMGPARYKDSNMFSQPAALVPPPSTNQAPNRETTQVVRSGLPPVRDIPKPLWMGPVLQGMCLPTLDELTEDIPITELCAMTASSTAGVIKITDIPYATPRSEMLAFLGKNSQILRLPESSPYHAVHILMERESGKTMDCYIELASPEEAAFVVRSFVLRTQAGRPSKVGERTVQVLFSSQDELLAELFPRAKHVHWKGGMPIVDMAPRSYFEGLPAAGFQGFLHPEEFVMMRKHATLKERSPFASKSPTRVYETMISILHKYPWYAYKYVTVRERDAIFECACHLMSELIADIHLKPKNSNNFGPHDPSPSLLQELVAAVLVCPGLSEQQKAKVVAYLAQDDFASMAGGQGINVRLGGSHAYAAHWPFAALSVIPGADMEVVDYYTHLIRAGSTPTERMSSRSNAHMTNMLGKLKISYKGKKDPASLTLAVVAKYEYAAIGALLRVAIGQPADPESNPFLDSRANTPKPARSMRQSTMTRPSDAHKDGVNGSNGTPHGSSKDHSSGSSGANSSGWTNAEGFPGMHNRTMSTPANPGPRDDALLKSTKTTFTW